MSLVDNLMESIDRVTGHGKTDVTSLESYESHANMGPETDFSRYVNPADIPSDGAYTRYEDMDEPTHEGGSNGGGAVVESATADVVGIGTRHAQLVEDAVPNNIVTAQVFVDTSPVRLVQERDNRASIVIYNTSQSMGATAYLSGGQASANRYNGFPIPPGSTLTIATTAELWINSLAATTIACIEHIYS